MTIMNQLEALAESRPDDAEVLIVATDALAEIVLLRAQLIALGVLTPGSVPPSPLIGS